MYKKRNYVQMDKCAFKQTMNCHFNSTMDTVKWHAHTTEKETVFGVHTSAKQFTIFIRLLAEIENKLLRQSTYELQILSSGSRNFFHMGHGLRQIDCISVTLALSS